MKIVNETRWSTASIKRLARAVARVEELDLAQIASTVITVKYRRRGDPLGRGRLEGRHVWLFVDRQAFDPVLWAKVLGHEFAHNQGVSHRRMGDRYRWVPTWRETWAWASAYPVELTPSRPVPSREDQASRKLALLEARQKAWSRKHKLATTWLRKIRLQRSYYERRLAALRAAREAEGAETGSPSPALPGGASVATVWTAADSPSSRTRPDTAADASVEGGASGGTEIGGRP